MADRQVTASGKDKDGDITALCNKSETWSPRKKADAIKDIEDKTHSYYVNIGQNKVAVVVIDDKQKGKYLRTDPDKTTRNNLETLPDC